jgi:hypothetical protein
MTLGCRIGRFFVFAVGVFLYVHLCVYVCVNTHIKTHIYMYMYIYIYIYIYILQCLHASCETKTYKSQPSVPRTLTLYIYI